MKEQKIWTKDEIKDLLRNNDSAIIRGLKALYNLQTKIEQNTNSTQENNGVGFNGADASILSDFAKQYIERNFLSKKQLDITRTKILKYAGQLARIANKEILIS